MDTNCRIIVSRESVTLIYVKPRLHFLCWIAR